MVEDIFTEERTAQNLENFIWSTVDESRIEDDMDPFLGLMGQTIRLKGVKFKIIQICDQV